MGGTGIRSYLASIRLFKPFSRARLCFAAFDCFGGNHSPNFVVRRVSRAADRELSCGDGDWVCATVDSVTVVLVAFQPGVVLVLAIALSVCWFGGVGK